MNWYKNDVRVGRYQIILADPPWQYNDAFTEGGVGYEYDQLTLPELCALPVKLLAADDAVLFMWGTYPQLPNTLAVISAWGFSYKSIAFQWVKYHGKKPFFGLGRWTRGNTEPCFLGVRGKPSRLSASVSQLIESEILEAPLTKHSAKPTAARDRIVELMGDLPRIELFSREASPGWDRFGFEAPPPKVELK